MFDFKNVSVAASVLTGTLFAILLLAPDLIFYLFAVEGGETARLISRRAAMLFLGLSVLSFLGRGAAHSELRQAVCLGLATSMLGLACVSGYEFLRGQWTRGNHIAGNASGCDEGAGYRQ